MENIWILISDRLPISGERCIVTDGEVIFIATYILESGGNIWMFSGLTESDSKNFNIYAWMTLPKPPEKTVKENEKRNDN